MEIIHTTDYLTQTSDKDSVSFEGFPKSDVLKYDLSDGKTYFIVRPSGTEPKIKIYLGTVSDSPASAEEIIDKTLEDIKCQMGI